jgi:hypothetical protein
MKTLGISCDALELFLDVCPLVWLTLPGRRGLSCRFAICRPPMFRNLFSEWFSELDECELVGESPETSVLLKLTLTPRKPCPASGAALSNLSLKC